MILGRAVGGARGFGRAGGAKAFALASLVFCLPSARGAPAKPPAPPADSCEGVLKDLDAFKQAALMGFEREVRVIVVKSDEGKALPSEGEGGAMKLNRELGPAPTGGASNPTSSAQGSEAHDLLAPVWVVGKDEMLIRNYAPVEENFRWAWPLMREVRQLAFKSPSKCVLFARRRFALHPGIVAHDVCSTHASLPLEQRRGPHFKLRVEPLPRDAKRESLRQRRAGYALPAPDDERALRLNRKLVKTFCQGKSPWPEACYALRAAAASEMRGERASIRQAFARDGMGQLCPTARGASPGQRSKACEVLTDLFSKLATLNDHNAPIIAARLYERLRLESELEPSCLAAGAPSAVGLAVAALYACRLARAIGELPAGHCPAGEVVNMLAPSNPSLEMMAGASDAALQLWALEDTDLAANEQLELVVEATLDTLPWQEMGSTPRRLLAGFIRAELEGDTVATLTLASELEPARELDDTEMSVWTALIAAVDGKAEAASRELELLDDESDSHWRFGLGAAFSFFGGARFDVTHNAQKNFDDVQGAAPFAAPFGLAYRREGCCWLMLSPLDPAQYLNQSIAGRKLKGFDLLAPSVTVAWAPVQKSPFFVGVSGGASRVVYDDFGLYVGAAVGAGWVSFPFSKGD